MERDIDIYIYHTDKNKMLIVNNDTKYYGIITDTTIINLFRTKNHQWNIHSSSVHDLISLIDNLRKTIINV